MALKLTKSQKIIAESKKELESLTNQELILRALSSLVIKLLPSNTYYYTMANVLRERAEEKSKERKYGNNPNSNSNTSNV